MKLKNTKLRQGDEVIVVSGITGGIVEKEMPINLSNVMIWNSATKKKDKIAFKDEKGKKIRVFRSTGKDIK